jgi:hypothetical protein
MEKVIYTIWQPVTDEEYRQSRLESKSQAEAVNLSKDMPTKAKAPNSKAVLLLRQGNSREYVQSYLIQFHGRDLDRAKREVDEAIKYLENDDK